jgi:hypothetical protein
MGSSSPPDRHPPKDAPAGTVWSGGPVDEAKVTLRLNGDELDPSEVSRLLGCSPSQSAKTGETITNSRGIARTVRQGFWSLSSGRSDVDVEDQVTILLTQLTSDLSVWRDLTRRFRADIFCGLFLNASNRGFDLGPVILRQLADRGISIGFDIYGPEFPDEAA